PVSIERTAVVPSQSVGASMAPLYTTLAIFIGSLLIMVAVKPRISQRMKDKLKDPKPRQLFTGHFLICALLSLAQTTFMVLGNLFFLDISVVHPLLFMLVYWFAGLVFTFIIYTLVVSFANLGKAIAVLMLIVQVTACNGSYPLVILPDFVQMISPWMPATHVVEAMRAAMFGIYQNDFWIAMGELALFLVPAALLGYALRKPLEKFMQWYVRTVESTNLIE
ncbi:MAG: YhgE/Pip family protein, partial [Eggerthellaceae bacterium]